MAVPLDVRSAQSSFESAERLVKVHEAHNAAQCVSAHLFRSDICWIQSRFLTIIMYVVVLCC